MRLTTKGRYGLRLILDIAQHESSGPVPMSEISLRQDISLKYLERLVGTLRRAGFVKSQRGRAGGHVLAVSPDKITVGDVVRALEDKSSQLACSSNRLACPRSVHCLTRSIWIAADQALFEKLDSVTVQDLLIDGQNCLARKEGFLKKKDESSPGNEQKQRRKLPPKALLHRVLTPSESQESENKTILVVDDDEAVVEYLTSIFEDRGYVALGATSAQAAMDILLKQKPDLITLDLEMPGEWGPKFHQRYSKMHRFKDIPVVVISGLPGIHRAIRKAVATVSKPFDPEDVLAVVERVIGPPKPGE